MSEGYQSLPAPVELKARTKGDVALRVASLEAHGSKPRTPVEVPRLAIFACSIWRRIGGEG